MNAAIWVVTAFVAAFVAVLGSALGRSALAKCSASWEGWRTRRSASKAVQGEESQVALDAQAEDRLRESLRVERVGKRFKRRNSIDDVGAIVTVVDLAHDALQWRRKVLVVEESLPGRREFDRSSVTRYTIDWTALMQPHEEQRRMTSRVVEGSIDAEGWVTFELMP